MSAEAKYPMTGFDRFNYSITYTEKTPESLEMVDHSDSGYEIEPSEEYLSEILREAYFRHHITSPVAGGSWESEMLVADRDHYEKGINRYYGLHITHTDGTPLNQEEHDFITALLNEGKYRLDSDDESYSEEDEWYSWGGQMKKYGVGGFIFGTILGGFLGFQMGKSVGYGRAYRGYEDGGSVDSAKPTKYILVSEKGVVKTEDREEFIEQVEAKGYKLKKILTAEDAETQSANSAFDFTWLVGAPKFEGLLGAMRDGNSYRYESPKVYDTLSMAYGGTTTSDGDIKIGDKVNLKEIRLANGDIQFERVEDGEVVFINDGIYGVRNYKTMRTHQVRKDQIEGYQRGGEIKEVDWSIEQHPSGFSSDKAFKEGNIMVQRVGGSSTWNIAIDGQSMGRFLDIYTQEDAIKKAKAITTYAGGGEITEGDKVIITTKSLGKDYEGMTGEITSRKLINDKYSIKLENGMTMAFEKGEFRHNSINPRYDDGGEIERYFMEGKYADGDEYFEEFDSEEEMRDKYAEWIDEDILGELDIRSVKMYGEKGSGKTVEISTKVKAHGGSTMDDWYDKAIEALREEEGDDSIEYEREEDGYIVAESDSGAEYMIFESESDAENYALDRVREDLEENPYYFTQSWLIQHIDQEEAENFFRMVYGELDKGYAEDIKTETDEVYGNRLISEMVESGIMSEEEANSDDALDIADERIEVFAEGITEDKISEGNGGYDHYKWNFGEEEAANLLIKNNLLDLDAASADAITTDGIAHFLAHYDHQEIELGEFRAYRTN